MLSGYYTLKLLEAAGLPPGVINFLPGDPREISNALLDSPDLAGVHFTGSTEVFNGMWRKVGENMGRYRAYPRLVGETGGKDFIVVHASADPTEVAVAIARGSFEYQGQKCSAASRIYVPRSLWNEVSERTVAMMKDMKVGDVADFRNFMGAVIDEKAFKKISGYIDGAKKDARVLSGGTAKGTDGYFIEPTLIETEDAGNRCLCEEIFGPVVTAYVYPDDEWEKTLSLVDRTSPYALTGAVFAPRPRGDPAGDERAPQRRREFLHQRQAHRRRRRSAAIRRRSRLGHERQGRLQVESRAVGECEDDQGDVRSGAGVYVSVHGRGIEGSTGFYRVLQGSTGFYGFYGVLRVPVLR